ncbi:MAG TPA: uracil-DNA glycosylase family protein, partial [Polyangiaceae bacterium]|nr:uracil-DNA glycosylase family protein [Polyangiaceae bacterium]
SEVSGTRLWGWAKDRFETPQRFFERFFILNYCPLVFMEASARNLTPDKLPAKEQRELFAHCDRALAGAIQHLRPRFVIGVGQFARARAEQVVQALPDDYKKVTVGGMLHPSPASPKANRGWAQAAEQDLKDLGLRL